ncbi:family 92 glycosyl hydrolase [Xylariales sp. AK1849]|nr:family 92 glycosyl hydrolase [Xylariales sp. AK1849]
MSRRRRRRVLRVLLFAVLACLATTLLPTTHSSIPGMLLTSFFGRSSGQKSDILDYIDPLIGTINGGHVFAGATLPYGMAKAVADSERTGENIAGFVSDDSKILCFSQLHDSGMLPVSHDRTSPASSLGNFPLFAHPGCPEDDLSLCQYGAVARAIKRTNGSIGELVFVEITTTHHTSLYRFNFPRASNIDFNGATLTNSPLVILDILDLTGSRTMGRIDVDSKSGRISGNDTFMPSFGTAEYTAYFCVDFRGAKIRNTGYFKDDNDEYRRADYRSSSGGGWVQFHPSKSNEIMARFGLSFLSTETACANAEREIPDFDFDKVVGGAQEAWRQKLSVIQIDASGVREDSLTTFWSGLYRTMISPQNYTGENPLWDSDEPYFDSFYCIWDSFRVQYPLLTIVDPVAQTDMVRTLIDIYKHEGKLPDCRMTFSKGITQGGSNADILLADAFVKGLQDSIDWDLGYESVVSDAEVSPQDYTFGGRGNIESYKALGYVPSDDVDQVARGPRARSISRSIEYAYDDFAIASIARGLGKYNDGIRYFRRSQNWKHLFNPDALDRDFDRPCAVLLSLFKGFPQPRKKDGTNDFQPSRLCSPLNKRDGCHTLSPYGTYEGSPWLYQFFVPQDMAALIELLGGPEAFVERLDYFHSSKMIDMGNEQAFLPTYQFHYASRPGRSSYWIHQYIPSQFNNSINGIPGNDDCAMGAFTAFAFMGIFPVAGQDIYLLSAPLLKEVRIPTISGKSAIIRNVNFDPTYELIYIESAKLNGKSHSRNWIKHDFFLHGGVLECVLGKDESSWGTRDEDLPPSLSTGTIALY